MTRIDFFSLHEQVVSQANREMTERLRPVHSVITKLIRKQECNVIVQLPSDQITNIMETDVVRPYRENIKQKGLWGLKLKIEPSTDEEGDKTWIKKTNVWYRMLKIAGEETGIGYKEPDEPDESLFGPASTGQLPYFVREEWSGVDMLLCAIGPGAQRVLQEAIIAEREFNPKDWDTHGYYVGPSKTQ